MGSYIRPFQYAKLDTSPASYDNYMDVTNTRHLVRLLYSPAGFMIVWYIVPRNLDSRLRSQQNQTKVNT